MVGGGASSVVDAYVESAVGERVEKMVVCALWV